MSEKRLADGKCPKCDSTVVTKKEGVIPGHGGSIVWLGIEVDIFECGKCGFLEMYSKR
jgi:predicted nucleic-acid-binding Zn-ribbon protein